MSVKRLKLPVTQLFVQNIVQTNKNTTGPLWRESTGDPWIPLAKRY